MEARGMDGNQIPEAAEEHHEPAPSAAVKAMNRSVSHLGLLK